MEPDQVTNPESSISISLSRPPGVVLNYLIISVTFSGSSPRSLALSVSALIDRIQSENLHEYIESSLYIIDSDTDEVESMIPRGNNQIMLLPRGFAYGNTLYSFDHFILAVAADREEERFTGRGGEY